VDEDEQIQDINICLQKEAEYGAKARSERNTKLRSTFEAVAREFAHRAKMLKKKNGLRIARDPRRRSELHWAK
jgi:hypothetical protein